MIHYRLLIVVFFLPGIFLAVGSLSAGDPILVEAESFAEKGGWIVDTQYMDVMGSPVLLAHGFGEPVSDASTEYVFPETGTYHVFVRTRNWVAPWTPQYAPGVFRLAVDGKRLQTVFGTENAHWHWQSGGTVEIAGKKVRLSLHDLTGFDGRIDAILFTKDKDYVPPEEVGEIERIRRRCLGSTDSPLDAPVAAEGPFDLVVVGGGFAGLCTSISAARLGCKVALVQDRPVLGGNNSSEVRVHLRGRMGYPPYPNLGNLVHELDPFQYGNGQVARVYKDELKREKVDAEKNLFLFPNTHVTVSETIVEPDGSIRIRAVVGRNVETGRETKFVGKLFADCTGDGNLGAMAGAEWRMGRESKAETGESLAPEKPDRRIMGASLLWYSDRARDAAGDPVETAFPLLPWAHQFTREYARPSLRGEWDWETGFNDDPIRDAEYVRDNGLRAVYGHWSYMKNQSEPEWRDRVRNRKLGWVAFHAGKRESRRLLGDVVLREQDLLRNTDWPDGGVVGTWTIDLHYPEPENAALFPGNVFLSVGHVVDVEPFTIPYRCYYSRNVSNLFMAGRCISVTHVALGAVRVMRTCGMTGEVVGMAASLAARYDATPRGVYEKHLPELKRLMETGVGPKPAYYERTARPRIPEYAFPTSPPRWTEKARNNLAREAAVSVSGSHPDGLHPPSFINDGRFDLNSDEGRWISDIESNLSDHPHWVELTFDRPVEIDAYRVLSGNAPAPADGRRGTPDAPRVLTGRNLGKEVPMYTFRLQRRDADRWIDIRGSEVVGNELRDVWRRFEPVRSRSFRLVVTETRQFRARLWELELYKLDE